MQDDQWIDTAAAAALAKLSTNRIARLANAKTLVARKDGRRWEISLASLNAYIERRADAGSAWGWPGDAGASYQGLSAQTLAGYATRNDTIRQDARLYVAAGRGLWVFCGFGAGGVTKWRAPNVT